MIHFLSIYPAPVFQLLHRTMYAIIISDKPCGRKLNVRRISPSLNLSVGIIDASDLSREKDRVASFTYAKMPCRLLRLFSSPNIVRVLSNVHTFAQISVPTLHHREAAARKCTYSNILVAPRQINSIFTATQKKMHTCSTSRINSPRQNKRTKSSYIISLV